MKLQFNIQNAHLIKAFFADWIDDKSPCARLFYLDECEPVYFDCSPEELANCFDALRKEGFTQSAKRIFQGDHFYRSDTGKCPRCKRYRPEIHWNNENLTGCEHQETCDRCADFLRSAA